MSTASFFDAVVHVDVQVEPVSSLVLVQEDSGIASRVYSDMIENGVFCNDKTVCICLRAAHQLAPLPPMGGSGAS